MKTARTLLAVALLTLTTASAAYAATIATAPAEHQFPMAQTLFCDIVNLNTDQKSVTIEIIDYSGNVTVGPLGPVALAPNQAIAVSEPVGIGAWCRWTVQGSAKKWRAVAMYDNGTTYTIAIPGQ